ncbi:MAG: Fic family protein [Alteromonadaceae bacterium]|jgi:Fic family protein
MPSYQPPFSISETVLALVADISELLGHYTAQQKNGLSPQVRRGNRIRTIHASLAIEHNTLTIEQVTALLEGKRVMGTPSEIQEVRNAIKAYETLSGLNPANLDDLLRTHGLLMLGLSDEAGRWRSVGVGIYRDDQLIHMPPSATQVPRLMRDLFTWLVQSNSHPLIKSCMFHYEFEFIHPFIDGNGRMGRFWQTLILASWREQLAYLPVETIIKDQQAQYYQALRKSDNSSDSTPFVEYMLAAIKLGLQEAIESEQVNDQVSDQVNDYVSDQVEPLIQTMRKSPNQAYAVPAVMNTLGLNHRGNFRKNYLLPALDAGLIEMTNPDSPKSPKQKYRLCLNG